MGLLIHVVVVTVVLVVIVTAVLVVVPVLLVLVAHRGIVIDGLKDLVIFCLSDCKRYICFVKAGALLYVWGLKIYSKQITYEISKLCY